LLVTVLVIVGVAVQVVVAPHAPLANKPTRFLRTEAAGRRPPTTLSRSLGWALMIVGIVVVAFALAREVRLSS
jgi:hypothetical protein